MNSADRIQRIKKAILAMPYYRVGDQYQSVMEIVLNVRMSTTGFASEVAKTVEKYGRVSEKQAYVIARAFVENNLQVSHGKYAGI
jgi:hypothetical protein